MSRSGPKDADSCRATPAESDLFGAVAHAGESDTSPEAAASDASLLQRRCLWCENVLPTRLRRDSKFCGKGCRQASWRFRVCRADIAMTDRPMHFAYADPPYPGKANLYPEKTEIDHASLIDRLTANYPVRP